ncbi:LmeA family phospholipid-binding protein [Calothrix sp. 336/3]|uniref:LmeA family phospholipid-binding protein n=1 Tax=Calothrix sp. 336/3 TaxID=1337936 RepID=UPI0004E422D8|nr:DUF2993 domain-containing protein [Calothrix sp. 336/3]AKG24016.1 hypothetical protein IJ00_24305 [Calothrix sp. 336/3]
MEFLTIFLSSLLGIFTPAGLIVERTAEKAIRSQLTPEGELLVRVDNAPTHGLLQGKVTKLRIAGRSLQLKKQDIRISLLELETDEIVLNLRRFNQKRPQFQQPIQAGVRLVLTPEDVNKFLQSPTFTSRLQKFTSLGSGNNNLQSPGINLQHPKIIFSENNRFEFQGELAQNNQQPLPIKISSGLGIVRGRQLKLIEPVIFVGGQQVPSQFVNLVVKNINQRLDLGHLDAGGLTLRILKLEMQPKALEVAIFIRIEPTSQFWETSDS